MMAMRSTLRQVPGDAVPHHQAEIGAAGHFPVLLGVDRKTLRAGRRRNVVSGPVAEIVAGLWAGMEDADMLIVVACQQPLHLGISAGRIADQHAVLLCDDRADSLDRRRWKFEYVA
jgi:hypothetical protein